MMIKTNLGLSLAAGILITGCSGSNSYTPPEGIPGGKIYADACANCHSAAQRFKIAADTANVESVAKMITEGGTGMPSFPNIKGESLKAVAEYVVQNSGRK